MSHFDFAEFETQVHELLAAYRRLQADYETLRAAHDAETRRTQKTRERLNGVIKRVRALEAEAGHV